MTMLDRIKKDRFLFQILVKRDFNRKYKRTILGILWSLLSPLLQLTVMALVFTQFFGRNKEHYIVYLFAGNLVFSYFKDSTSGGMSSLMENAQIFTKVNVKKYLFILSKNFSALVTFLLNLCVFFLFVLGDKNLHFSPRYLLLIYPVICLLIFNIGVSFILSSLFVVFKDIKYLYDVFTQLLNYFSAVFYYVDSYPERIQQIFYVNPIYVYIRYFRIIVIEGYIPGLPTHLLCAGFAVVSILVGSLIYHKNNKNFLYYL